MWMKQLVPLLAAFAIAAAPRATAAAAPSVEATSAAPPAALQLRPKSAMPTPAKAHTFAPFVAPLAEPELDLLPRIDPRANESRSSCERATTLCYDPNSRRIVYKPARALMPDLPGMQAENISVKRDRITFKYSF
jgi:hypothetical protein